MALKIIIMRFERNEEVGGSKAILSIWLRNTFEIHPKLFIVENRCNWFEC